jgi:putative endonuclease
VDRAEVWHIGEDLAAAHLTRIGWRILDRNWRCAAGELDIIAVQPGLPSVVVFCEVKCRRGTGYGQPLEAITAAKLAKLRQLALHWLQQQDRPTPRIRFDGIGVLLRRDAPPVIEHLQGIC